MTEASKPFEHLMSKHQAMLPTPGHASETLALVDTETIKSFLTEAAAAGANIVTPEERREVHSMLRFWAAELITRGELDWIPPTLADAEVLSGPQTFPESSQAATEVALARSRAIVRIAASARQWQQSRHSGWLLKGEALREAQRLAHENHAIQSLVDASQAAERRASWIRSLSLLVVIAVLAGLCIWLLIALRESELSRQREKEEAAAANAEAVRSGDIAKQLSDAQDQLRQRGQEQQQQLNEQRKALLEVAKDIRKLRDEQRITPVQIPHSIQPYVDELDLAARTRDPASEPQLATLPLPALLRGYDPDFLRSRTASDITIPLPKPAPGLIADLHDGGRPVPYVNFSLIFNAKRRMPLFTAVNLQRSAVATIARVPVAYTFDPRINHEIQLSPNKFTGNDLDRGNLVNAREIAWGPAFDFKGNAELAGQRAYGLASLMTNVTPQFDTFNQGLWAALDRYSQQKFSADSDRIVILSGPVFAKDDPNLHDMTVPRSFWKVLVTTRPDNPASLLVEAYLASQFEADGRSKIERTLRFDQQMYRLRVAELERLTGLDFGELVRAADTVSAPAPSQTAQGPSNESRLSTLLHESVGSNQERRRRAVTQLLALLKDDERLKDSELKEMVADLVAYASDGSFKSLSSDARVNVLTLMIAVQKTRWDLASWINLKAVARRAVADAGASLPCTQESEACVLVDKVKPVLDWPLASDRMVYVQFAGMVREDVIALNDKLKILGWQIPANGGERIASAAGRNEVRYAGSEEDRRAAELLAADLRVLGRSTVKAVRANVKPKTPEIWISI